MKLKHRFQRTLAAVGRGAISALTLSLGCIISFSAAHAAGADSAPDVSPGPSSWLSEANQEELDAVLREMIEDSSRRRSLLSETGRAGWDNGFYLESEDGSFRMRILGQIQFRGVWSVQDNSTTGDDSVAGFENSRTRIGVKGHLWDPSFQFFLWPGWGASGGNFILDAWVSKQLDEHWKITFGQFKLPNWHEWIVSETRQQFVERSLVSSRFQSIYSQGVKAEFTNEDFRFCGAFSDGLKSFNNAFNVATSNSTYLQAQNEYAFTGRVEYLFEGDWKTYDDFQGWPDGDITTVLGGAAHYQEGEFGDATVENEVMQWTVDASHHRSGMNLFAAIIGTHVSNDAGLDRDELGLLAQAGYFVTENLELVGRYEWGDLDGAGTVAGDDLSILTVGFNYFYQGHAKKWTTDVGYALEPVDAAWGGAGRGWRGDAAGEDGQIVIRSQFNILF